MNVPIILTLAIAAILVLWFFQKKGNKYRRDSGCQFCGRVIGHKFDCPLHSYHDRNGD